MITQKAFINWILVYLLLFLSGSWRYGLSSNKFLVLGFLISLAAWYIFTDRKISDRFLFYAIIFTSFLFSLSLYTGGGITINSVISGTMKMVIAYLILRTVGASFPETYIRVVVFLAVISLFGYLSDSFQLFDGLVYKLPFAGNDSAVAYDGIFYLFRFSWHIKRNNSIFFEPGAYQAFLNAALFLLSFTRTNFEKRKKWSYMAILVTTLITTFSTTGFVIFLVMLPLFFYRSEILTFSGKMTILGVGFVVVGVLSTQFYSGLVVKLNDYLTAQEYETGVSAVSRGNDLQTDLKVFKEHIFGLGLEEYKKEFQRLGRRPLDKVGSSNGITSTLAVMGLPWSLFIFGSYYWALGKILNDYLLAAVAFIMLMLFFTGEAYYVVAPISFAIIAAAFVYDRSSVKEKLLDEAGEVPKQAQRPLE